MDWLRSCHNSTRAVFRNDPTIVLPGYYYFSPENTPFYEGLHWYGAASWMGGEYWHNPPLGEQSRLGWRNGRGPTRLPLPRLVGDKECISLGGTWPVPGDIDRTVIDGIDSRCYLQTVSPCVAINAALTAIDNGALQAVYARLIQLVYDENWPLLQSALNSLFDTTVSVTHIGAAGVQPARAYVDVGGCGWLVLISGTSSFQQLALQSFSSILGPVDYGGYGTNATWQGMSTLIGLEMNALGIDVSKPIVISGHSYGAAVAAVLAAQIEQANPDAALYLLTFAMPKPGNAAVSNLLASVWHVSVVNHNDLVHVLAPDGLSIAPFIPIMPLFWPNAFTPWQTVPSYLVLDGAGTATMSNGVFIDAGTLGPLIDALLAGQPLQPISGHPIGVYVQNLWLVQSAPAWPVPAATWNMLFPTFTRGGGIRGNGTGNNTDGVLLGIGGLRADGAGE